MRKDLLYGCTLLVWKFQSLDLALLLEMFMVGYKNRTPVVRILRKSYELPSVGETVRKSRVFIRL